jgi:hypothetical protein
LGGQKSIFIGLAAGQNRGPPRRKTFLLFAQGQAAHPTSPQNHIPSLTRTPVISNPLVVKTS